jgi:hypothetical protein
MPHPLPWYIAGPVIGLIVPARLLIGNEPSGISSTFRHICAAAAEGSDVMLIENFRDVPPAIAA